jgi:hypothetical protein
MDARSPQAKVAADKAVRQPKELMSHRALLKPGLLETGAGAATLVGIDALAWAPASAALAATAFPAIQFDIENFLVAQTLNGISFKFPPVSTVFLTATLNRVPFINDQGVFSDALETIESHFAFSSSGIFSFVSYGIPYFNRLPAALVASTVPRLLSNGNRFALEEAIPGPTDALPAGAITSQTFQVNVAIEQNDVLFTFLSDSLSNIQNVIAWLKGSNSLNGAKVTSPAFLDLFTFTSMWMGFSDQLVNASAPATMIFQGNGSLRCTTATSSSYFANGSIQHLSHVTQDLAHLSANGGPYVEWGQPLFRPERLPGNGPGFDDLNVPDSSNQPKFPFSAFAPTAEFFQSTVQGLDGSYPEIADAAENDLERFSTAGGRQNFLIPSRTHRAFPLLELI